jgi:formylglycine-generating enzyme required for sulfatase activity
MKAIKLLVTLGVLLTTFLVAGIALANDPGIFDSVSSDSALEAPKLTVKIEGVKVTLSWSKVTGAADYEVHYAQAPYDHPRTIGTIDVGNKTSAIYMLAPGSYYHIAVKACDASGFNCGAYSTVHEVHIPLCNTFVNSLGQAFRFIPAGTFTMGSPSGELGRNPNETQHQVTLTKPFYIQTTEVTQEQWEAVMGSNPSRFAGCPTCPVESVSWDDAQSYIIRVNARAEGKYSLPSAAQWEYAARAGSTTAFYNGQITKDDGTHDPNADAICWYDSDNTHPVAKKKPNAWGLYDTSGNVGEWCQDIYNDGDRSGYEIRSVPYNVADASGCRTAIRYGLPRGTRTSGIGFRLAMQYQN